VIWIAIALVAFAVAVWALRDYARARADERIALELARTWAHEVEKKAAEKAAQAERDAAAAAASKPSLSDDELEKDLNR
jgi:hypothetical protein